MSKKKIEIKHSMDTSSEEGKEKQTDDYPQEEMQEARTITTSDNAIYTEEMLLNRIDRTGLLDDYIGGREITERSTHWVECFSREDLLRIFTTFPSVYERCNVLMSKTLGPAVKDVPLFHDTFCNLFENILEKAKNVHLRYRWAFGENTAEFHEFELAISLLYTFLEEDSQASTPKEPSLAKALNKFAESEFVKLRDTGLAPIYSQLYQISQHGHCSAGFTEQLSKIYTAMMLVRAILFYGNVLQKQAIENTGEQQGNSKLWDYRKAAVFFKMKPELKKEMDSPLYHGNIDTEAAKRLLSNPGEYLARYSARKEHYLSILIDSSPYNKIVLNLTIPGDKLESWIEKPIENREEIELFIKEQLSKEQPKIVQPFIANFFANEQYSPVFNSVCSADIRNAALGTG
ncbi:hypothetical protein [Legionella maioricensis]|uniref:Uncharacterized protein n=1 Tax=Legionella maioricensis TaxID=2896528 RepID=A0A9X2IBE1_9GAMM|nr:hypothetical protein [Legionella maioricensis]MCL9684365.1 hypothetical protein [Legionella maioricensis]MCL9687546.1 hypothetical protein [Legionella maioricensis]